jgi:isopentenyl-diphosphate delta-isomerase
MPRPGPNALIDRVDERNRSVGTVARQDVFKEHANFRTVHVLVLDRAGNLLLQQLAVTRERHPLSWGSSVAGYLYAGESHEGAAKRRLREELGLETQLRAVGVTPMEDEGVTKFVGVFVTVADHPRVQEPDHIAAIEFRPQADIERDIQRHAGTYTDSLRHVLAFWLQQGRPGLPE